MRGAAATAGARTGTDFPLASPAAGRASRVLEHALALPDPGTLRLREAMRYSVLGGGKRLRPTLVYLTGDSLGAPLAMLDAPAAAVELIHVYSLVHDDLPAMDDDDLRRGRPTCHRAYDEATAILVGDALQALAFAVLANEPVAGPSCAGAPGDDPTFWHAPPAPAAWPVARPSIWPPSAATLTVEAIENMHRRKTGALIEGSVLLGALGRGVTGGPEFAALQQFGAEIGLAFQIQDDILDVEGDPAVLGKSTGADAAREKPTYPSTVGLAAARVRARELRDAAIAALEPLGGAARALASSSPASSSSRAS